MDTVLDFLYNLGNSIDQVLIALNLQWWVPIPVLLAIAAASVWWLVWPRSKGDRTTKPAITEQAAGAPAVENAGVAAALMMPSTVYTPNPEECDRLLRAMVASGAPFRVAIDSYHGKSSNDVGKMRHRVIGDHRMIESLSAANVQFIPSEDVT